MAANHDDQNRDSVTQQDVEEAIESTERSIFSRSSNTRYGQWYGDTYVRGDNCRIFQGNIDFHVNCTDEVRRYISEVFNELTGNFGVPANDQIDVVQPQSVSDPQQHHPGLYLLTAKESPAKISAAELWYEKLKFEVVSACFIVGAESTEHPSCEGYKYCNSKLGSSVILLETRSVAPGGQLLQRLRVLNSDLPSMWLPNTRVGLRSRENRIRFRFSNCNRLERTTRDGRMMAIAAYNPDDPNVEVEIEFRSKDDAYEFAQSILCRKVHFLGPGQIPVHSFKKFTFVHQRLETTSGIPQYSIRVWTRENNIDHNHTDEEHDEICFTHRLDLQVNREETQVSLGYVDWLHYHPTKHSQDLLHLVPQTVDGGPASVTMEGGHLRTSSLVVPTDGTELKEVINGLLESVSDWHFELCVPEVMMEISRSTKLSMFWSKLPRYWSKPEKHSVQITVWSCDDKLKILMRKLTENYDNRENYQPCWSEIFLDKRRFNDMLYSKQNDQVILLKSVEYRTGPYLLTRNLEPQTQKRSSTESGINNANIELCFKRGQQDTFKQVVNNHFFLINNTIDS